MSSLRHFVNLPRDPAHVLVYRSSTRSISHCRLCSTSCCLQMAGKSSGTGPDICCKCGALPVRRHTKRETMCHFMCKSKVWRVKPCDPDEGYLNYTSVLSLLQFMHRIQRLYHCRRHVLSFFDAAFLGCFLYSSSHLLIHFPSAVTSLERTFSALFSLLLLFHCTQNVRCISVPCSVEGVSFVATCLILKPLLKFGRYDH
jgi:hypothetical protein